MKIHLSENFYYNADKYNKWITEEKTVIQKDGRETLRSNMITGYHSTFNSLLQNFIQFNDCNSVEQLLNQFSENETKLISTCAILTKELDKN